MSAALRRLPQRPWGTSLPWMLQSRRPTGAGTWSLCGGRCGRRLLADLLRLGLQSLQQCLQQCLQQQRSCPPLLLRLMQCQWGASLRSSL